MTTTKPLPRRTLLSATLAAAAAGVAGCNFSNSSQPRPIGDGTETGSGQAEAASTLRQFMTPVTFIDPAFGGASTGGHLLYTGLMEGLVMLDPDDGSKVMPLAAEEWTLSDDGRTYTFHIRKNATWSNGDSVTADDFVWNWKRGLSPKTAEGSEYQPSYGLDIIQEVEGAPAFFSGESSDFSTVGVKAADKHTLTITLSTPDPRFLTNLASWRMLPLHPKTVEEHPQDFAEPDNWVGNGPYILTSWRANSGATLTRNDDYWDSDSYPIRTWDVTFNAAGDTAAMVTYKAGETDLFREEGDPAAILSNPGMADELKTAPYTQFKCLQLMASENPALEDIKVRQALSLAIDREAVAKVAKPDAAGATLVPRGITGYDQVEATRFDPDKAKQLLADAGYPDGKGLETLRLLVFTSTPWVEAIGGMWKDHLNVAVSIDQVEVGIYKQKRNQVNPKDYIGFSRGYFGLSVPTIFGYVNRVRQTFDQSAMPGSATREYLQVDADDSLAPGQKKLKMASIGERNWWPEYKKFVDLVDQAREAAADPAKVVDLSIRAATALEQSYVALPVLWAGYSFMVKPRVKNLKITSYPDRLFTLKDVTLDS